MAIDQPTHQEKWSDISGKSISPLLPPPNMKAEKGSAAPSDKVQVLSQADPDRAWLHPQWAEGPQRASLPICKMGIIKALILGSSKDGKD